MHKKIWKHGHGPADVVYTGDDDVLKLKRNYFSILLNSWRAEVRSTNAQGTLSECHQLAVWWNDQDSGHPREAEHRWLRQGRDGTSNPSLEPIILLNSLETTRAGMPIRMQFLFRDDRPLWRLQDHHPEVAWLPLVSTKRYSHPIMTATLVRPRIIIRSWFAKKNLWDCKDKFITSELTAPCETKWSSSVHD